MPAAQNNSAGQTDPLDESVADQATSPDPLTPLERAVIELEKRRFRYQGSKEQAIQKRLGLSPVAYYQQLNSMLDNPRVVAAEPLLMNRLRRHRDALS
ncbi:DUF3263 domain-containing protein [Rothia endophytica]|uniref:DUF3263 domain-containing protein n=1 Tax=Rothia endophytica TaxID=1324766 RepID=UPI001F2ED56B|nr:DUF3263 domain-containing protein [Rothia endophytica]